MRILILVSALSLGLACAPSGVTYTPAEIRIEATKRSQNKVFQGAFAQLAHPASYDGGYYSIKYPNGDVAADRGACADVVVRALRNTGIDLQRAIHEDAASGAYPRIQKPDANIDHRRVLNQEVWLKRHGTVLTTEISTRTLDEWQPGDIVSWRLPSDLTHIGIVSDRKRTDGVPFVIHNIGTTAEEDALTRWKIAGHFRCHQGRQSSRR